VLNPKTALFFLAFLPQFVDPSAPVAPQMLLLGTMLVCLGVLSDGTYALVAAGAGNKLRNRRRLERWSGGVFVALGVVAAVAGEPRRS
jgi:threonine/homoserine/homoserine lactone efflux protein